MNAKLLLIRLRKLGVFPLKLSMVQEEYKIV